MTKIKNSATSLLLAFSMLCSIMIITPAANAEVKDPHYFDSFITGVDITYTNDSGQHTATIKDSGNPDKIVIQTDTTVGLKYYFSLPDELVISSGDQYTMSLPGNLPVAPSFKGKTGNVGQLGTYQINDDQTVTITFNDFAATHESRGGDLYVETSFSGISDGGNPSKDIVFNIQGKAVTISVDTVYSVVNPAIEKDGSYTKDSGVTWAVTVHSGHDKYNNGLTNAIVTDTPGDYQNFKGDVSLKVGNGSAKPVSGSGPTTPYYEVKDSGIVFHLGDIPADTDATIVYTSGVSNTIYQSNKDQVDLTNTVKLGAYNVTVTPTATKTINVPVDWISKDGSYNSTTGKITWTITVNPQNQPLPAGATVTDTLSRFLSLDPSTVQVNGSPITGDKNQEIYFDASVASEQTTVKFHFTKAAETKQVITFETSVEAGYYNTNSGGFTNKATLTTDTSNNGIGKPRDSTTGTVGPASSVITKAASGSYNASTHQLSWKITVNSNRMAITKPVVTDTIDKRSNGQVDNHQKIISVTAAQDGSAVTLSKGTDADTGAVPFYFISPDEKTLTVHLENFNSDDKPVVLTVVSEVTDPAYYAVNGTNTAYNTALLTGSNSAGGISQSVTASQDVKSQVIVKSAFGTYDYSSRLLGWQIAVNQNNMLMTAAVITDTIPAGLTLKEDTTFTFNGTPVAKGTPKNSGDPYYTFNDSLLTIHLGNLSAAGTVRYYTAVDIGQFQYSNQSLTYDNTAKLVFSNGTASGVSSNASQTVTNSVIEKGYQYTNGNLYIDWQILINRNQVQIGNGPDSVITITDNIPSGLSLDTGTVAFYPVTVSNNGKTFTNGAPVALERENIGYNAATGKFIFTFPQNTDLSRTYRLEFRTFVTDKSKSPFRNTVNFQGIIKDQNSTSGNVNIVYQSADGDGWGTLPVGSITVHKQDDKDNSPLSGAEFTLYDLYGNPVQIITTDAAGKAVFSRLSYGTYSLSETKTPDGYKQSAYYKTGIQVSSASKNIILTVANTKMNPTPDPGSSESSGSESSGSSTPGTSSPSSSSGGHGHSGNGGGGGSNSTGSSTLSSVISSSPSSGNPNEPVDEGPVGQVGPGSSSSANPNETLGDDNVGQSGPVPKTGENPLQLPVLATVMGVAIVTVVVLRKKITG